MYSDLIKPKTQGIHVIMVYHSHIAPSRTLLLFHVQYSSWNPHLQYIHYFSSDVLKARPLDLLLASSLFSIVS